MGRLRPPTAEDAISPLSENALKNSYRGAHRPMTKIRPYFKLGIADLESIFDAARTDSAICQALIEELGHRSTERATALLKRIESEMAVAAIGGSTSAVAAREQLAPPKARSTPIPRPAPAVVPVSSSVAIPPPVLHARPVVIDKPNVLPVARPAKEQPVSANALRREFPAEENKPSSILAAWTALEALSPQTYRRPADLANGDGRCVAQISDDGLPWFREERSRPKQQLYYQVILGSVHMDQATDALIKAFGEDEERGRKEKEKAALAAILLDRNGVLLEENSVAVSSFGWALPIALTGKLEGLGAWSDKEKGLVEDLTKQLARTDRQGSQLPLDVATLEKAFKWLVAALNLAADFVEPPTFVLRVYHYFKSKNPPEVALLNSFCLGDLAKASQLVADNKAGAVLARYLGAEPVEHSPNMLGERSIIERLVAPSMTPASRWPAPGSHPLVTLQQAAVNAARSELLSARGGIVAVNGPPGTGKTTLLRDIVASCVLDRAKAMAAFDDPLAAFKTTGQKVAAGDRAFLHLYSLDDSLKGHEVVVASSNNKAVENVSRELPALKAVGRDVRYFRTVSDRLMSRKTEDGQYIGGEPTWGLIAAVLGNALNRGAFQQALWWDDDRSLRLYLKAAKGDSVVREVKDEAGQVIRREIPSIIETEAPPDPEQAKVNWRKVRTAFKALLAVVEKELGALEDVRQVCLQLAPARAAMKAAADELEKATNVKERLAGVLTGAARAQQTAEASEAEARRREQQGYTDRPAWWHRLFNTQRNQRWRTAYAPLAKDLAEAERLTASATTAFRKAEQEARQADAVCQSAQERFEAARLKHGSIERLVEQHRQVLGERLVDEKFFDANHARWNLASPWLPDTLHQKREDLFALAMGLHKAFIDVTAQKVSHNLGVLMGAMSAGAFQDEAKKALLPDLWSTLFVVCPVVSTTFASVDRMLGDMPPASLGWVLVDEAGQATPQSAVGLLMRARKAVVVGDPLQIPPVVSLPQRLIVEVTKYFGVAQAQWLAPEASVQTVADDASCLRAEFRADVGVREVGIPLLVHRRCQEPMFGISNRIAYDGQMVHAAGQPKPGAVARALGASGWIDVTASAQSKWCPAEGEAVIQLLNKLATAGVREPDIYIITPFRIVANELRRRIEQESGLFQRLGVDGDEWLRNRVGTIHTFQGKEAEAVIAVLGAPMVAQQGARRWAASTPNIFNVMVSRAKQTLYIVGSRSAWSTVGHGRLVAGSLPPKT